MTHQMLACKNCKSPVSTQGRPIHTPVPLSAVSPKLPSNQFQCWSGWTVCFWQRDEEYQPLPFSAPLSFKLSFQVWCFGQLLLRKCLKHLSISTLPSLSLLDCFLVGIRPSNMWSVSLGQICLKTFPCCHTKIKVSDQTCFLFWIPVYWRLTSQSQPTLEQEVHSREVTVSPSRP